ncbi:MAG: BrnT family toxin [Candidatus Promineofilum sp.]|nr:BrnT family toxin [Promineifilum sp.]
MEHIADHGVEPFEAEEVINNRPLVSRAGEGKLIAYGQTDVGRYLVVVYALKDKQRLRVITARDMTQAEKSRIRGRRK